MAKNGDHELAVDNGFTVRDPRSGVLAVRCWLPNFPRYSPGTSMRHQVQAQAKTRTSEVGSMRRVASTAHPLPGPQQGGVIDSVATGEYRPDHRQRLGAAVRVMLSRRQAAKRRLRSSRLRLLTCRHAHESIQEQWL